jgi:hypothetical protein
MKSGHIKRSAQRAEIDTYISFGKWLAGVSGIGVVIACSLVIASYATFVNSSGGCKSRLLAADAISGGFFYARWFLLAGPFSLASMIAPTVARALHYFRQKRRQVKTGQDFDDWQPTSRLVDWQLIFAMLGLTMLVFGLVLVQLTSANLTATGLEKLTASLDRTCSASATKDTHPPQ